MKPPPPSAATDASPAEQALPGEAAVAEAARRSLDGTSHGIRPGVALRVTDVQPFGGPVFVEVDGKEHALGGELAEKMRVEPAGSA